MPGVLLLLKSLNAFVHCSSFTNSSQVSTLLRLVRLHYVFWVKKWRVFEILGVDIGEAV